MQNEGLIGPRHHPIPGLFEIGIVLFGYFDAADLHRIFPTISTTIAINEIK